MVLFHLGGKPFKGIGFPLIPHLSIVRLAGAGEWKPDKAKGF